MAAPTDEIARVLTRLCDCWTRLDLMAITELWDLNDPEIVIMPQEIEQPLVGEKGLRNYLTRSQARLHAASMRFWNLRVRSLAPDLAGALYEMHWNGQIGAVARPLGSDTRVTAIFRRRKDQWRFTQYIEAPVTISVRVQQAYLDAVDADFLKRIGWENRKNERRWPDGTPLTD